ncbi:hypothetical protein AXF42_Ash006865 [Apostasia shenzhenica]|uniref:Uncharacterized protein n=1 Tax=Apostasia shenzhenica TaxID=1088818 RepID=A0A2I0AJC5_9ASPA|nr:hypothetical protein AXF42_Ash006865 [Apostasia shenzhenica]
MDVLREQRRLPTPPSPIEIPGRCRRIGPDGFTQTELAAAEQLVQLSESSGDSSAAPAAEDATETMQRSLSSALSSSSSPVSVVSAAFAAAEDDGDEDGELRRLRPRFRRIGDVYASAALVEAGGRRRTAIQRRKKRGNRE